jgi:hypothetical protein
MQLKFVGNNLSYYLFPECLPNKSPVNEEFPTLRTIGTPEINTDMGCGMRQLPQD